MLKICALTQYVVVALKVENTISMKLSSGNLMAPKGDNIQSEDALNKARLLAESSEYTVRIGTSLLYKCI